MNNYYAYVLIDPRTSQPFYAGKGKGRRMYDHWKHRRAKNVKNWRLKNILCELEKASLHPVYVKVLDLVSEHQSFKRECELIEMYGRQDNGTGILCNLTNGGQGYSGKSKEFCEKRRQHELSKNKGKPVCQYTMSGGYIQEFPSAKRASETVIKANRSYITQCCKKKRKSAGGFLWVYKGDIPQEFTKEYYRSVHQYTKDGQHIGTFKSLTEAAKFVGLSVHAISDACRGVCKTAAKYVWKYAK